jgi:hypothetical protein
MNQASIAAPKSSHEAICIVEAALLVDCARAPVCVTEELEPPAGEPSPAFEFPPFEPAEGLTLFGALAARTAKLAMVLFPVFGLHLG